MGQAGTGVGLPLTSSPPAAQVNRERNSRAMQEQLPKMPPGVRDDSSCTKHE